MLGAEILKEAGIDYDRAVERCMGSEELFACMLSLFLEDDTMEQMEQAFVEKDYPRMFRCAHTMKGTCCNVEMTALYQAASELTELLRNNLHPDEERAGRLCGDIKQQIGQIRHAIKLAQEEAV